MSYSRILLPVDGSEHSMQALTHAIRLAQQEGEIYVITVVPEIPAVIGGEHRKEAEEAIIADTRLILDPVQAVLAKESVKSHFNTVFNNSTSDGILKAAQEYKCDAIVMGTRGRNDFEGLFLGSVTHSVLTHASVPVLVVH